MRVNIWLLNGNVVNFNQFLNCFNGLGLFGMETEVLERAKTRVFGKEGI
jgi:hypothetical protein